MSVNEIIREALIRIEREHGVAITGLRAEWINTTHGGSIRYALSALIEIESYTGSGE